MELFPIIKWLSLTVFAIGFLFTSWSWCRTARYMPARAHVAALAVSLMGFVYMSVEWIGGYTEGRSVALVTGAFLLAVYLLYIGSGAAEAAWERRRAAESEPA